MVYTTNDKKTKHIATSINVIINAPINIQNNTSETRLFIITGINTEIAINKVKQVRIYVYKTVLK